MLKRIAASMMLLSCFGFVSEARSELSVNYKFIVVGETFSAKRIVRNYQDGVSNLFPWVKRKTFTESREIDEIVVSNNCGFANYEYNGLSLENYHKNLETKPDDYQLEKFSAVGSIGEWCKLGSHLYERETLLTTRSWKNKLYILDSTEVYFNRSDDDPHVIDIGFINKWKLNGYMMPIKDAGTQSSCLNIELLTPYEKTDLLNEGWNQFDKNICAVKGLYIRDIPRSHKLMQGI